MKLFLGILLLLISTIAGFRLARRYTRRVETLNAVQDYLLYLKEAVAVGRTPYPLILAGYAKNDDALAALCRRTADAWQAEPKASPDVLWRQALQEARKQTLTCLKPEDIRLLEWIGTKGAQGFPEGCFAHGLEQAVYLLESAREKRQRCEKMVCSLGILVGLVLMILIL